MYSVKSDGYIVYDGYFVVQAHTCKYMKNIIKDGQNAVVYEPRGCGFESCQARHSNKGLGKPRPLSFLRLCRAM